VKTKLLKGPLKRETEEKGTQTSENPPSVTQLAAERASSAVEHAKEAAVGAAATAATTSKETARKVPSFFF
jgi:hypothetical protein